MCKNNRIKLHFPATKGCVFALCIATPWKYSIRISIRRIKPPAVTISELIGSSHGGVRTLASCRSCGLTPWHRATLTPSAIIVIHPCYCILLLWTSSIHLLWRQSWVTFQRDISSGRHYAGFRLHVLWQKTWHFYILWSQMCDFVSVQFMKWILFPSDYVLTYLIFFVFFQTVLCASEQHMNFFYSVYFFKSNQETCRVFSSFIWRMEIYWVFPSFIWNHVRIMYLSNCMSWVVVRLSLCYAEMPFWWVRVYIFTAAFFFVALKFHWFDVLVLVYERLSL